MRFFYTSNARFFFLLNWLHIQKQLKTQNTIKTQKAQYLSKKPFYSKCCTNIHLILYLHLATCFRRVKFEELKYKEN